MTDSQHMSVHTEVRMLGMVYRSLLCLAAASALIAALLLWGIGELVPHFHSITSEIVWNETVIDATEDPALSPSLCQTNMEGVAEPAASPTEPDEKDPLPRFPIITRDIRAGNPLMLRNETLYTPDVSALLSVSAAQIGTPDTTPTVLIIHTHATEAYAEDNSYTAETPFRSTDPLNNMIAVGNAIAEVLCERGFRVIHCTEQHDALSFNAAYENSAASVRQALREHPEITYILDVHRDAIEDRGGNVVRCATEINGQSYAQMMLVVGTDERGAQHPFWRKNLSLALALQSRLCDTYPGLMRQINLRGAAFNQQYSPGYLLLEVGSSGNTLEEAKAAARLFAVGFAEVIDPHNVET